MYMIAMEKDSSDDKPYTLNNMHIQTSEKDSIIYINPIHNVECRNALITKENIDLSNINDSYNPIWSREYSNYVMMDITNLNTSDVNPASVVIRFPFNTDAQIEAKDVNQVITNRGIPIYYAIRKSASTSIHARINTDFGNKWNTFQIDYKPKYGDNDIYIDTNCGYTFVRNPIYRFISGYYTISEMLYQEYDHHSHSLTNLTPYQKWIDLGFTFFRKFKEPDRFTAFVDDMISNPYLFSIMKPFEHIRTQAGTLYNTFGTMSNITFIGKVEFFDTHWDILMNHCEWFKQHYIGNESSSHQHAMKGFGAHINNDKSHRVYERVMGMRSGKYANRSLSPAYYIIAENETLYDILVDYYWQDFICFEYVPNFEEFRDYVIKHGA